MNTEYSEYSATPSVSPSRNKRVSNSVARIAEYENVIRPSVPPWRAGVVAREKDVSTRLCGEHRE
jgi:hypothetical protein